MSPPVPGQTVDPEIADWASVPPPPWLINDPRPALTAQAPIAAVPPHLAPHPPDMPLDLPREPLPGWAPLQLLQPLATLQPVVTQRPLITLRPEDVSPHGRRPTADPAPACLGPAHRGWRGRLNRASGGILRLASGDAERADRQASTAICQSLARPLTVAVVQAKGGAGRTPTVIGLAAAFGTMRADPVVAWDCSNSPTTLAGRLENSDSPAASASELLDALAALDDAGPQLPAFAPYVRRQPTSCFDALVTDNPFASRELHRCDLQVIHTELERWYRITVVDTGSDIRSPHWQVAVDAADVVVVVSPQRIDHAHEASWMLDHLHRTGREQLARSAVTVLTDATGRADEHLRAELRAHFGARTAAVVEVPYDAAIGRGGTVSWPQLGELTRAAWIRVGAAVVGAVASTST